MIIKFLVLEKIKSKQLVGASNIKKHTLFLIAKKRFALECCALTPLPLQKAFEGFAFDKFLQIEFDQKIPGTSILNKLIATEEYKNLKQEYLKDGGSSFYPHYYYPAPPPRELLGLVKQKLLMIMQLTMRQFHLVLLILHLVPRVLLIPKILPLLISVVLLIVSKLILILISLLRLILWKVH